MTEQYENRLGDESTCTHTQIHTNTQFGKMNLDRELEGAEDATAFDRAFNYSVRSSISYAPHFRCYWFV